MFPNNLVFSTVALALGMYVTKTSNKIDFINFIIKVLLMVKESFYYNF